jgi:hypothetical protein
VAASVHALSSNPRTGTFQSRTLDGALVQFQLPFDHAWVQEPGQGSSQFPPRRESRGTVGSMGRFVGELQCTTLRAGPQRRKPCCVSPTWMLAQTLGAMLKVHSPVRRWRMFSLASKVNLILDRMFIFSTIATFSVSLPFSVSPLVYPPCCITFLFEPCCEIARAANPATLHYCFSTLTSRRRQNPTPHGDAVHVQHGLDTRTCDTSDCHR